MRGQATVRRVHLVVKGRVQGVYFRQSTKEEADRLRLRGWVRNLANGDVEALVEGDAERVDQLIRWAHRGPPSASVTSVVVNEPSASMNEALTSFEVRR